MSTANLEQRLVRSQVDLATAIEIAVHAAAGLADAREHGVIHRDLKPANLFLTRERHRRMAVNVLDFGIAKLAMRKTQLTHVVDRATFDPSPQLDHGVALSRTCCATS